MASNAGPDLPLSPYRVLDLTDEKGFLCSRILGDLGADVIKIEPPGGDPSRRHGPYFRGDAREDRSLYWFAHNYNKRGITLNLSSADGRHLFLKMVRDAHFVIETMAPGKLDQSGLGFAALQEVNPSIIMTSITPFGPTGPYREYAADDIVVMAAGGLMSICGDDDRPPVTIKEPQAAMLVSVQAATATTLAHYSRTRTGLGAHINVSMQEAVANVLTTTPHFWFADKAIQTRGGRSQYGGRQIRTMFPASDGYVATQFFWSPGARVRIQPLIDWMVEEGCAPSFEDFDFDAATGDTIDQLHLERWEEELAAFFSRFGKARIYDEALKRRLFIFPVNSPSDLLQNEQLSARGFFQQVKHPKLDETITYPGAFCAFSETPISIRRPAPLLGEHNLEIYQELGLNHDQLVTLAEAGIV